MKGKANNADTTKTPKSDNNGSKTAKPQHRTRERTRRKHRRSNHHSTLQIQGQFHPVRVSGVLHLGILPLGLLPHRGDCV